MLSMLALGLWPRFLDATICEALISIQKMQYNPIGSALRLGLVAAALPWAFHQWGLPGAVIVIALADIPNYTSTLVGLVRNGLSSLSQDFWTTLLLATFLAAALGARHLLALGLPLKHVF